MEGITFELNKTEQNLPEAWRAGEGREPAHKGREQQPWDHPHPSRAGAGDATAVRLKGTGTCSLKRLEAALSTQLLWFRVSLLDIWCLMTVLRGKLVVFFCLFCFVLFS